MNELKSLNKPIWISHRGLKAAAVENTLAAFRAAVAHGFVALETDLRLTADGHIALLHDPDLRRIAGKTVLVAELNRVDLARVQLGGTEATPAFLDEFLTEFSHCRWTFDIKPENGVATINAFAALIRSRGLTQEVLRQAQFVTWNAAQEAALRAHFPTAVFYARESECWRAGISLILRLPWLGGFQRGRIYALPPRLGRFSFYQAKIFAAVHRRGAKIVAFLPSGEADVRAALAVGADEILTDGEILS